MGRKARRDYAEGKRWAISVSNQHHRTSFVSRELYDRLEVGSPVKVVYLPHRPSVSGLLLDVDRARRALERKT